MEYVLLLCGITAALAACAVSLSFLLHDAGMVSTAHGGMVAVGAYAYAIAVMRFGANMIVAYVAAAVGALLGGLIIGSALARLNDEDFVLGSLAVQLGAVALMRNWNAATNGNLGLSLATAHGGRAAVITACGVAMLLALGLAIYRRTFGASVLHATRDDRTLADSIGLRTGARRAMTFGAAAAAAGIAGATYGRVLGFLHPDVFSIDLSLLLLTVVVIGGQRRVGGILLAAAFCVILPESLRFLPVGAELRGGLRQISYNLILAVAVGVVFRHKKLSAPAQSMQPGGVVRP